MAGANLNYTRRTYSVWYKILKLLFSKTNPGQGGKLCTKAGVPADNTADDDPNAVGDICLDTANNDVYVCTARTDSTTHDWVKITA